MDPSQDGIAQLLEMAGDGDGSTARIRRWSLVLLALGTALGVMGLFCLASEFQRGQAVDAASLEAGENPFGFGPERWWVDVADSFEVSGRLRDSEAIVVTRGSGKRVYAPIVSQSLDPNEPAHLYVEASEADYARARTSKRYSGKLFRGLPYPTQAALARQGRPVPDNCWTLYDRGWRAFWNNVGQSFIVVAIVLGALALIGLSIVARRANDAPSS